MFKLVTILLIAASIATGAVINVHDAIEKELQPDVDELLRLIQLEYDVARIRIDNQQSDMKTSQADSANDLNQEIKRIRAILSADLESSATKKDKDKEKCIKLKLVEANSLTTTSIGKCSFTEALSRWNSIRNIFVFLKTTTSSIISTCRQLNPVLSQAGTMRTCIDEAVTSGIKTKKSIETVLLAEFATDQTVFGSCITKHSTPIEASIAELAGDCSSDGTVD